MSPSNDQFEFMRAQLQGAIEMQTTAFQITARKIEAMNDAKKAQWRVLTAQLAKEKAGDNDKDLIEAIIELRRADTCVRTAEIEQTELHHAMEGNSLEQMKEQLAQMISPSPIVGARLIPKSRFQA